MALLSPTLLSSSWAEADEEDEPEADVGFRESAGPPLLDPAPDSKLNSFLSPPNLFWIISLISLSSSRMLPGYALVPFDLERYWRAAAPWTCVVGCLGVLGRYAISFKHFNFNFLVRSYKSRGTGYSNFPILLMSS